jgi:putative NADH-flavin reductase
LVRDPSRLGRELAAADVVTGDAQSSDAVAELLADVDVLVNTIGHPQLDEPQHTRELATRAALAAVTAAGRPVRYVAVASAAVLPGADGRLRGERGPERYRHVFADHRAVYELLAASDLDWVLACPLNIPDGPATGTSLRAVESLPTGAGKSVTTGELARVVLEVALAAEPSRVRVGIAEPA